MTFTKNSYLVQFYVKMINEDRTNREDVPNLFNLREIVFEVLDGQ